MKYIILTFLLICSTLFAQPLSDYYSGRAGDVLHLTGSALGTLAIQKTFDWEWHKSAAVMFSLGFVWESFDEVIGRGVFDPAGFSGKDLLFDGIGVLLSYPLRYKNLKLSGGYNEGYNISLSYSIVY